MSLPRRASRFVSIAALAVGAGCAREASPRNAAGSEVVFRVADEDFARSPVTVPAAAALSDLAFALRAFDGAYPAGAPARARIEATRAQIAASPTWSPSAFASELAHLFQRRDGHLAFGYGGVAPIRPRRDREPGSPLPFDHGTTGPDPSGFVFATAVVPGNLAGPVASVDATGTMAPADAVSLRVRSGVPVLAIRTFDSAARERLDTLPAYAVRLRRAAGFVVDVRGNGGGNFGFAERFVLALTDARLRGLDELEVVSVAAAAGRANSVRRRLLAGTVPDSAVPLFAGQLDALEAEAERLATAGAPRQEQLRAGRTVRGTAEGPLRSRVVVLVDRGCASACEMFVALVRQIPGIVVAGEATRGSMAIGELALFRLPTSGVTVSFGTRAFRDPSGRFEELRGYEPDVVLAGPDPLQAAAGLASTISPL